MSIKAGDASYLPPGRYRRAALMALTNADWRDLLAAGITVRGPRRTRQAVDSGFQDPDRLTQINATPLLVYEVTIGWATRVWPGWYSVPPE